MKTLSQFLSLISEAQKVNIGRLDPKHHELWKTTGHKSLLDDLGSGATSEVTKKVSEDRSSITSPSYF